MYVDEDKNLADSAIDIFVFCFLRLASLLGSTQAGSVKTYEHTQRDRGDSGEDQRRSDTSTIAWIPSSA